MRARRRLFRGLVISVAAVASLVLGGSNALAAPAAQLSPSAGAGVGLVNLQFEPACINCQQGTFVNMAHGLCLDAVRSGDGTNGDRVQLWACNGGVNQLWHQFDGGNTIINTAHNLCLDAERSGDGTNGDRIQLWACNGGSNQQWFLCANFTWCNSAHGLCLDAERSGDGTNGDKVQLWGCNGGTNQKWNAFV